MPVLEYKPNRYHHTFGAHPPVLALVDGDEVVTTTIDAAGVDQEGNAVAPTGNPLTGPFRIEGAEAGDALSVRIVAIKPNRDWGYSSNSLAAAAVDPDWVRLLPESEAMRRIEWHVDVESWIARPTKPLTGLQNLVLPLSPMVGCIGVAPENSQFISSATSGSHGGNMDCRQIRVGTTLHLPVFEDGALLCFGDCHALQGAGELAGTGIEVSCDVKVEVRLRKDRRMAWPRGETDDSIFVIGNGRPLDQAIQHANTELMRWLISDYDLDAISASVLIGQCADVRLANMYNPAYSMVVMLAKSVLPNVNG